MKFTIPTLTALLSLAAVVAEDRSISGTFESGDFDLMAFMPDSAADVARTLQVSPEAIRLWIKRFLLGGVSELQPNKSPGRPSKNPSQTTATTSVTISRQPKSTVASINGGHKSRYFSRWPLSAGRIPVSALLSCIEPSPHHPSSDMQTPPRRPRRTARLAARGR